MMQKYIYRVSKMKCDHLILASISSDSQIPPGITRFQSRNCIGSPKELTEEVDFLELAADSQGV